MRYGIVTILLLLAAPLAAQLQIGNRESCEAGDVIVADEDGKLSCSRTIQFEAVDITADHWCREPDCSVTLADDSIEWDWPEEIEFTTHPDGMLAAAIGPETGLLLRLDGTWQLMVNGEPYVCTPEEDRR